MSKSAVDPARDSGLKPKPRKLIVCIDGTSNQFSEKNTNVVELYSRITKDSTQLTYYNSGIGTYARPFWWSFAYLKQQLTNTIDLMIAWNFEKVIVGAYRWLADNYRSGDQVFLFGFSRGAYQVGLIHPGNQEQIPFAWAIYSNNDRNSAQFKAAFCREKVDLHFVGVWDTVASVGLFPRNLFPLTDESYYITHFRHALALDERRVKFLPEYVNQAHDYCTQEEVWFAGTHSDIGGGNKANSKLDRGGEPLKWMLEEAQKKGLSVRLHDVKIDYPHAEVTNSMRGLLYLLLEILPISWKKYHAHCGYLISRRPHLMKSREVLSHQSIHWTVGVSINEHSIDRTADPHRQYVPRARFLCLDGKEIQWKDINTNNRELWGPKSMDEYQFTRMVNILKKEPLSAEEDWFSDLHDYTCRTTEGVIPHHIQREAIWAYGGPQLLQRLFNIYPSKPETAQIARSIIGLDPGLQWHELDEELKSGAQVADEEEKKAMADHLRDIIIPRVGLLLEQWAATPPKVHSEHEIDSESETEPDEYPKPDRWTPILGLFGFGSTSTREANLVGAKWNLDRVPKEHRSNDLARVAVGLVSDITKTIHVQVIEESSTRLATQIAELITCLTATDENKLIESAAAWGEDKTALAKGVLNAVAALFKYDGSRQPFYEGGTGRKLQPLIRASQEHPNLALQAMRTVVLLSQDHNCGLDISESDIIQELFVVIRGNNQMSVSQMERQLVNEARTTVVALSENIWCGSKLAEEDNLDILFALLDIQAHANSMCQILQNISKNHPSCFSLSHTETLAQIMHQNVHATLTLAHIAESIGLSYMHFREGDKRNRIVNAAIKLLNHPQETQVLASTHLLRSLLEEETGLRGFLDETEETYVTWSEISQAITSSLQAPSRSQKAIEEILAISVQITLIKSIPANQFAVLTLLASAGNKQAILAASAAAAYTESYQQSISQYIPALIEMAVSEGNQFLKNSVEVLASLVSKGFVLPVSYLKSLVESVARIIQSAYPGSLSVSRGQRIITIAALKLVEGLCTDSVARKCVAESGLLRTIILNAGGDFMGYNSRMIENYANAMVDRLSQYNDIKTNLELLGRETEEFEFKGKRTPPEKYGEASESGPESEFGETSPLISAN